MACGKDLLYECQLSFLMWQQIVFDVVISILICDMLLFLVYMLLTVIPLLFDKLQRVYIERETM